MNKTNFYLFITKHLPNKIKYFCFIQVMAHATTGKYSSTVVPELSGMDALKRFEDDCKI